MAKSKSKLEEARKFLDDLDSLSAVPPSSTTPTAGISSSDAEGQDPAEELAFIDKITQEPPRITGTAQIERPSSRAGTPTIRKSSERVRLGGGKPSSSVPLSPSSGNSTPKDSGGNDPLSPSQTSGWGWGSVWSSASAAIQQAKTVVDEQVINQVRNLPANEQARKVLEYAKATQLEKFGEDFKRVGLSTLTDILNVVAPPISKHEVIQVWLSHDMKGYDGTESVVYSALARIMEQVEGGDLVVNRGNESKPKSPADADRDLNTVNGYDAALKLAQANINEIIKSNVKPAVAEISSIQSATTYSQVYLRIQPFLTPLNPDSIGSPEPSVQVSHLQFILYLSDPAHQLVHTTVTQAIPAEWIEVWDEYDWVEDLVAEALRLGVEVLGQEYVVARMGWRGKNKDKGKGKAETTESESDEAVIVDEKGDL